jgi:hypothetical protein
MGFFQDWVWKTSYACQSLSFWAFLFFSPDFISHCKSIYLPCTPHAHPPFNGRAWGRCIQSQELQKDDLPSLWFFGGIVSSITQDCNALWKGSQGPHCLHGLLSNFPPQTYLFCFSNQYPTWHPTRRGTDFWCCSQQNDFAAFRISRATSTCPVEFIMFDTTLFSHSPHIFSLEPFENPWFWVHHVGPHCSFPNFSLLRSWRLPFQRAMTGSEFL